MKKVLISIFIFSISLFSKMGVLSESSRGFQYLFDISNSINYETLIVEDKEYQKISFDGSYNDSFFPELENPKFQIVFASPTDQIPQLNYEILSYTPLPSNPIVSPKGETKNGISSLVYKAVDNPIIPENILVVAKSLGYNRGHYLFKLEISPIDFVGKRIADQISISVDYGKKFNKRGGDIDSFWSQRVINSEKAHKVPKKRSNLRKSFTDNSIFQSGREFVEVVSSERGFLKVSYGDISSIDGFGMEVPIEKVRVFSLNGKDLESNLSKVPTNIEVEIPREVYDENKDGVFNANDYIVFFSPGRLSKTNKIISQNNIYKNSYWAKFFNDKGIYLIEYSKDSNNGLEFSEGLGNYSSPQVTLNRVYQKQFIDKRTLYLKNDITEEIYRRVTFGANPGDDIEINLDFISDSDSVYFKLKKNLGKLPDNIRVNGYEEELKDITSGLYISYISPSHINSGRNVVKIANNGEKKLMLDFVSAFQRTSKILSNIEYDTYIDDSLETRVNIPSNFSTFYDISDPLNPKKGDIVNNYLDLLPNGEDRNNYKVFILDPNYITPSLIKKFDFGGINIREDYSGKEYDIVIITPNKFYDYWIGNGDFLNPRDEDGFIEAHMEYDNLNSVVINLNDINIQFGRGYQEPNATRNFIRYAKENWGAKYIILSGDGHYDYRNIYTNSPNLIFPYFGYGGDTSLSSDDFYGNIENQQFSKPDIALGRFIVNNISELSITLKKIVEYIKYEPIDISRLRVLFTADDDFNDGKYERPAHVKNTELRLVPSIPKKYMIDKLYMWDYPAINNSNGGYEKPAAERDLVRKLNDGRNLFCYVGHGSPMRIAAENLMNNSTLDKLNNLNTFLFMAASCSVGNFEDATLQGGRPMVENLLLLNGRGANSAIASTRSCGIDLNEELFKEILRGMFDENRTYSIGEALVSGKLSFSNTNSAKFILLGDPALTIFRGIDGVSLESLDSIYTMQLDSIKSDVSISNNFNGEMIFAFKEGGVENSYYNEEWNNYPWGGSLDTIRYTLPGDLVFKGLSSIKNSKSTHKFILPKDLSISELGTTIHFYGKDKNREVSGYTDQFELIPGENQNDDKTPPKITIKFNNGNYQEGDPISSTSIVYVDLFDESGINISGSIGHSIILEIDGRGYDITPNFTYYLDSYKKGFSTYQLEGISKGKHTLKISAFDNFNNYSEKYHTFEVVSSGLEGDHTIGNLLNYPNPAKDNTYFTFVSSEPLKIRNVGVKIYTVNGRLIKKVTESSPDISGNFIKLYWDLKDDDGDKPSNGVYIYKVKVYYDDNSSVEKKGKLI
ncbi:MAG: hypothetical protein CSA15_03170, partial [Candidatus Delongbacteria bacterium]